MSTCEIPSSQGFVAQPWSVFVNAIILIGLCFIWVLYSKRLWNKEKGIYIGGLIGALIIFESIHLISHAIHVSVFHQTIAIHIAAWGVGWSLWWTLRGWLKFGIDWRFWTIIVAWILDILLLWQIRGLWSVYSGVIWILWILLIYAPLFPRWAFKYLTVLLCLSIVGAILFLNEHLNCDRMMRALSFPYHALNEIIVGAFIAILIGMLIVGILHL